MNSRDVEPGAVAHHITQRYVLCKVIIVEFQVGHIIMHRFVKINLAIFIEQTNKRCRKCFCATADCKQRIFRYRYFVFVVFISKTLCIYHRIFLYHCNRETCGMPFFQYAFKAVSNPCKLVAGDGAFFFSVRNLLQMQCITAM